MIIKVNGKNLELANSSISIKELLLQVGVESIEMVSVQLNGSFIPKEKLEDTSVKNDDEIDFLFFMGGGSIIEKL